MSQKLVTDIILNLKGNLSEKAKRYGANMTEFAQTNKRAMAAINSSTAAASKGIDTFGNRLMVGAGVAAVAFERTFIKTAAEFERYQIMLNKLQGSESDGEAAMEWIQKFTQDTPFAINEVTRSFVRLKALGLDPMDGTMQAIADQAAILGGTAETVDGIALALGQAWTKGKLQGEEAMQLLERGVPVWDYLVKASKELGKNNGFGYTAEQLQEMASKGKLGRQAIQDLIDQMARSTKGAARAQMESWGGMVSNMGDMWTFFKKDVMDSGAFDVLKEELAGLLAQLDEMKETGEYDELVEDIGEGLVDSFRAAADAALVLKDVGADLLPILDAIGDGASAIAEAVGGYENLAKAVAGVYAANKAIRFAAPAIKGAATVGGWAAGKVFGKGTKPGKGGKGGFSDLGAMPVYVVNMPAGGIGGNPDLPVPGNEKPPKPRPKGGSNLLKNIGMLGTIGYGLSMVESDFPLVDVRRSSDVDLGKDSPKSFIVSPGLLDVLDDVKTLFGDSTLNKPSKSQITKAKLDAYLAMNESGKPSSSLFGGGMMHLGQMKPQELNVHVTATDDRIKVKTSGAAPGLNVDIDTGRSINY